MTTLDSIRAKSEADFIDKLKTLGERHRRKLIAARKRYGSVKAIPDSVWIEIAKDTENETAALLLLIFIAGYVFTMDSLPGLNRRDGMPTDEAKRFATRRGKAFGEGYAETTRKRWEELETAIDDLGKDQTQKARLEATERGLGEILNAGRAEGAGITETTGGLSAGQRQAGDDGRTFNPGVTVTLFWKIEDEAACPVCKPLDGKSEAYCESIGIGQPAHPRCRCEWVAKLDLSGFRVTGEYDAVRESLAGRDGDGDGLVDDGKPTERPAPPKVKGKAFQDWAEPGVVNINSTASPDFEGKQEYSSEFTAGGRKFYAETKLVDPSQFRGKLPGGEGVPVFGFVDEDGEYKVTGKGNAMSTMRQAAATAIAMLKTSDADIMVFQDGEGGSRGKLYSNFTRRAASLVDGYRGVYIGKDSNGIMTFGVAKQSYIDGPLKSHINDGIVELAESQGIIGTHFLDDPAFWDAVFKGLGSTTQKTRESLEPKDGDGDGLIDDGKPTERPATIKPKVNPKVLAWAKKKFKDDRIAQNFAEWFGDSKVVDEKGEPLVVYHGTSEVFDEFDPEKGVGAGSFNRNGVFFAKDPGVASSYAEQAITLDDKRYQQELRAAQSRFSAYTKELERITGDRFPERENAQTRYLNDNLEDGKITRKQYDYANSLIDKIWDIENSEPASTPAPQVYPAYVALRRPRVVDANGLGWDIVVERSVESTDWSKHDGIIFKNIRDNGDGADTTTDTYFVRRGNQIKSALSNSGAYSRSSNKINESL